MLSIAILMLVKGAVSAYVRHLKVAVIKSDNKIGHAGTEKTYRIQL